MLHTVYNIILQDKQVKKEATDIFTKVIVQPACLQRSTRHEKKLQNKLALYISTLASYGLGIVVKNLASKRYINEAIPIYRTYSYCTV